MAANLAMGHMNDQSHLEVSVLQPNGSIVLVRPAKRITEAGAGAEVATTIALAMLA